MKEHQGTGYPRNIKISYFYINYRNVYGTSRSIKAALRNKSDRQELSIHANGPLL